MKNLLRLFLAAASIVLVSPHQAALAGKVAEDDISIGSRHSIQSNALGELREIWVSVPSDRSQSYPVIYVLNAETEFLSTVATVRHLSDNSNRMPNFIVVGVISNDGAKETRPSFPSDGSKNTHEELFRQFVAKELLAHVDSTYNTQPFRILVGHSLSGLFTLNTLRSSTNNFDAYFAFSPALWWDNGAEARAILQSISSKRIDTKMVVITVADEGEESLDQHRGFVDEWNESSSSKMILLETTFPDETHSSTTLPAINWSLQHLFAGWRPDANVYQQGLAGLEQHYDELSTRFGWEAQIPLDDLSSLVFEFARRGDEGDDHRVYELINYALDREPEMHQEFTEMTGALKIQGHVDGAATVEQALCNIEPSRSNCSN